MEVLELDMDELAEMMQDMQDDEDIIIWTDSYDVYFDTEEKDE